MSMIINRRPQYDTDTNKLERVWKRVHVNDQFSCYSNEQNHPDRLAKWLEEINKIAKKDGLQDLDLDFIYRDNEVGTITGQSLVCYAYRMETNDEYKERLRSMLAREKNEKFMFEQRKWRFTEVPKGDTQTPIDKAISDLETRIKQVK